MAKTVAAQAFKVPGDRFESTADVTFDASYTTGGYALTAADMGFQNQIDLVKAVTNVGPTGHTIVFNKATGKLMLFSAGTEVTAATNVSTVIARVVATGY